MTKKIIPILFLFLTNIAFAHNIVPEIRIIENEKFDVLISSELAEDLIQFAAYEWAEDDLVFKTNQEISFIQIFNEQEQMIFQLRVSSKKVVIGTSLFNTGSYKLAFLIDGNTDIQFTTIEVK